MTHKRYRSPEQGYARHRERESARQTIERDLFNKPADKTAAGTEGSAEVFDTGGPEGTEEALNGLDLGELVASGPTPEQTRPAPATGASGPVHQPAELAAEAQTKRKPSTSNVSPEADLEVHKPTFAKRVVDRLLGLLRKSH